MNPKGAPAINELWPKAKIAALTTMCNAGKTTSEIANELGISRNAVIGKAHRLRLTSRPSPLGQDWPEYETEILLTLQRAGKSYQEIADALGKTRDSVIHKVYRLRIAALPPELRPVRHATPRITLAPLASVQAARMPMPPKPPKPQKPSPNPRPLTQNSRPLAQVIPLPVRYSPFRTCQWIYGENVRDFKFCAEVTVAGKSYCTLHTKIAYVPHQNHADAA